MMEEKRDHGGESMRNTGSDGTVEPAAERMMKTIVQGAESGGGGGEQEDQTSPSGAENGADSREAGANGQHASPSEQKAIEISVGAKISQAIGTSARKRENRFQHYGRPNNALASRFARPLHTADLEQGALPAAQLELVNKPSDDDPQPEQHESMQSAALSKNALKKQKKRAQLLEQKSLRKQREKRIRQEFHEMRRIEREELLQSMTEEERETYRAEKRARSLELRAKEKQSIQTTRKMIAESKQRVCIDMEWHSQLTEKELNSLYKQLNYTYAAVRKAVAGGRKGLKLIFTGVDAALKQDMQRKVRPVPVN
mmetsp:Transcript_5495/g.23339  ORF Transcript_5495/g.23339 Transcript_5495/m.23339 type:complete len:313 (-) Transcript_5495:2029-2967(-)